MNRPRFERRREPVPHVTQSPHAGRPPSPITKPCHSHELTDSGSINTMQTTTDIPTATPQTTPIGDIAWGVFWGLWAFVASAAILASTAAIIVLAIARNAHH
jgi:hypothetical protein